MYVTLYGRSFQIWNRKKNKGHHWVKSYVSLILADMKLTVPATPPTQRDRQRHMTQSETQQPFHWFTTCTHSTWLNISDTYFHWSVVTDWLKSPKTECFNLHQDLSPIEIQFWWSRVQFFYDAVDKPSCYCFSTKFKHQVSPTHRGVDKCIRTSRASLSCFGWSKRPCVVHSQRTWCFVGCRGEPKVTSWSETTPWQLFQDWLSVTWTSIFHVLFQTKDLVFFGGKSGFLLFLHRQDTVSYWNLVSRC